MVDPTGKNVPGGKRHASRHEPARYSVIAFLWRSALDAPMHNVDTFLDNSWNTVDDQNK